MSAGSFLPDNKDLRYELQASVCSSSSSSPDPWSAVMHSKVSTKPELVWPYSSMNPQMCQMFTCPCFPLRIHNSSGGGGSGSGDLLSGCFFFFFSARTLAGRWVCCWRSSEDHGGQKCRWIAPRLLPDVFTPLTVLALLLGFFSVFPSTKVEDRLSSVRTEGEKRKSLQCVYITSRFRKRRRRKERSGRSEPPCVRHETTHSRPD